MRGEDNGYGRRRLLETIGSGVAAGATTATAGCLSSLPAMAQQIRYGDVTVPEAGDPIYREWIPAGIAASDRSLLYLEPVDSGTEAIGIRPLGGITESVAIAMMDYYGVGFENYDHLLTVSSTLVGLGAFDAADVAETITEQGYEPVTERGTGSIDSDEEYSLFRRPDTDKLVAVRDGTLVVGSDETRGELESVIDTGGSRQDRLSDTDEAFTRLTDELGAHPAIMFTGVGETHPGSLDDISDSELRDSALSYTYDDESVYHQFWYLFESDVDVSERRIRDALESNDRAIEASLVAVTVDGSFVRVDMEQSHEDARDWYGENGQYRSPQVTWWYERDGETVRVSHRGGETVDANTLIVGFGGGVDNEYVTDRQFHDEYDTVGPGDSITVDVRNGELPLTITFQPVGEGSQSLIGSYSLE